MDVVRTIAEVRRRVQRVRSETRSIGFVPTMGALHAGHASLIETSVGRCDYTVVSIFVNPTQFGPQEDLASYPRPFEADAALCRARGVDLLFAPDAAEMYGPGESTRVEVSGLTESLCGLSRPGHFRGVTTVCAKLFNVVLPDVAFFGQKDAQQSRVIRQMVQDLNMPLTIEVCPTIREADGLALSSRNRYLNPDQRRHAPRLYQALLQCQSRIAQGERRVSALLAGMTEALRQIPSAEIDYVSIVDDETLKPVEQVRGPILIALAVHLGPARLIDNILVDPGPG